MYKNIIQLATIAILFSQCNAKTDLRELQALQDAPSSSFITEEVKEHKISADDSLLDDQVQYLDWMEFAQQAFKGLSEDLIQELMAQVPEFEQLNKPSPFSINQVTGIIDDITGEEIGEDSIKELMKMGEQILKSYQGATEEKPSGKSRQASGKHHRNLESFEGGSYIDAIKKIQPILKNLQKAQKDAKPYGEKASKSLEQSYKFIRGSVRVLYIKLKSIESEAADKIVDVYETENKAITTFELFVGGLEKAEKYLEEASNLLEGSTYDSSKSTIVLEEQRKEALATAEGTSKKFRDYKRQLQIQAQNCFGSCNTGPFPSRNYGRNYIVGMCSYCLPSSMAIVEMKLANFKDKNQKLADKLAQEINEIELTQNSADLINEINELKNEVHQVGDLVRDAQFSYELYMTEDAGQPDGNFAKFLDTIKNLMNL